MAWATHSTTKSTNSSERLYVAVTPDHSNGGFSFNYFSTDRERAEQWAAAHEQKTNKMFKAVDPKGNQWYMAWHIIEIPLDKFFGYLNVTNFNNLPDLQDIKDQWEIEQQTLRLKAGREVLKMFKEQYQEPSEEIKKEIEGLINE